VVNSSLLISTKKINKMDELKAKLKALLQPTAQANEVEQPLIIELL